jgi:tellurite resistance protein TehA-like permease
MDRAAPDPGTAHAAPSRIATLFPGYFALVMATGIVSIAAELRGFHGLAVGLLWFNLTAYLVLWALSVARAIAYPSRLFADLTSHQRGATFLTVVAATNVLGSELLVTGGATPSGTLMRRRGSGSSGSASG